MWGLRDCQLGSPEWTGRCLGSHYVPFSQGFRKRKGESRLTLRLFHAPPWGNWWRRPFRNGVSIFIYDTVRRDHDWNSESEGDSPESPGKAPAVREPLNWRWIVEVSGITVSADMTRTSTSVRASLTRCLTRMISFDSSVNGSTNVLSFNLFPSSFISASNLLIMG